MRQMSAGGQNGAELLMIGGPGGGRRRCCEPRSGVGSVGGGLGSVSGGLGSVGGGLGSVSGGAKVMREEEMVDVGAFSLRRRPKTRTENGKTIELHQFFVWGKTIAPLRLIILLCGGETNTPLGTSRPL